MDALKDHKIIAFDFDDTLIGHPHSRRFQEYIKTNPHGQEFHIVSFRSHGMEENFARDLALDCGDFINLSHFAQVHHMTDQMFEDFHNSGASKLIVVNHEYLEWKAVKCKEIGATVLIDDMAHWVKKGCDKHGILHIHPDDL